MKKNQEKCIEGGSQTEKLWYNRAILNLLTIMNQKIKKIEESQKIMIEGLRASSFFNKNK